MRAACLLPLLLGACATGPQLPADHTAHKVETLGDPMHLAIGAPQYEARIYIDPECLAHIDEVRAVPVPVVPVPRDSSLLRGASGRYYRFTFGATTTRAAYIRNDALGWFRQDIADHELCHAWKDITTGNPHFHRANAFD